MLITICKILNTQIYKKSGNKGFFDEQETEQKLSGIGNPLEMISKVINFGYTKIFVVRD